MMKNYIPFSDVIIEAEFWSVDPYMRYMVKQIPLDSTMVGTQVARYVNLILVVSFAVIRYIDSSFLFQNKRINVIFA